MRIIFFAMILMATGCSFNPPEPVVIQTPTTTASELRIDSNYFSITILNNGYETSLANRKVHLKTIKDFDEFIESNHRVIDSTKILIFSLHDTPSEKFKAILEVLKKHNYLKFQLVSK
jgi:hypothetical protein